MTLPAQAPDQLVWSRFLAVLGLEVEPVGLAEPDVPVAAVGAGGAEVLRRVNAVLADDPLTRPFRRRAVDGVLARGLAASQDEPIGLPEQELGWVRARATEWRTGA